MKEGWNKIYLLGLGCFQWELYVNNNRIATFRFKWDDDLFTKHRNKPLFYDKEMFP